MTELESFQRQYELDKVLWDVCLLGELLGGGRISLSKAIKHLLETWQNLV